MINTPKVATELVEYFGGNQTATAKALNVKQPTVNGWLSGKHGISAGAATRAEKVTNGEFKAVNLCAELSDQFGAIA